MTTAWSRIFVGSVLLLGTGCHSAFVQVTIRNDGPPIRNFEMDYPSQSFGQPLLGTGQVYHYKFKVQGTGPVKFTFTDAAGKPRISTGPVLDEKAEGNLEATIGPDEKVDWKLSAK